jgi:hypothetical protein
MPPSERGRYNAVESVSTLYNDGHPCSLACTLSASVYSMRGAGDMIGKVGTMGNRQR